MEKQTDSIRRVILVSNRLPFTLKRSGSGWRTEKSVGGLASATGPILKRSNGIWIGWTGDTSGIEDRKRNESLERWARTKGYLALDLPPDTARGFYDGYSNQTIWPLFHYFTSHVRSDPREWRAYVDANAAFCDAILTQLKPGDLVWIHDYHLMLLPRMLRQKAPDANIGFFLHIPFPSSSVFRVIPNENNCCRVCWAPITLPFTHIVTCSIFALRCCVCSVLPVRWTALPMTAARYASTRCP